MKTEDAVKMIELCLESITNHQQLTHLILTIIDKRIDLATPKKRGYKRKEETNEI